MKKHLLTMVLTVAMLLPFALNAQNTQTFNFEEGVVPAAFTNDSIHPWTVVDSTVGNGHQGTYCIKSGNGGIASSTSTLSASFTFAGEGYISFLAGIYGEGTSTAWDKCIFKIDGVQQFAYGALQTWTVYTFEVDTGLHTFEWTYQKDSSVDPTGDAFYLDSIVLDLGSATACTRPGVITVSNITSTTADISWLPGGNETSWNIYLDSVLEASVTTPSFSFTGLSVMTTYNVAVEADCGTSTSTWRSTSFNTACGVVELPYTETFQSTSATRDCWELVATGNIGGSTGMGFVTVNNRETLRFSSYSNASDYNQYGFSPMLNVSSDATNLMVNVVYATYGSGDILNFGYITATDTVWAPVDYTTTGNSDFRTFSAVVPATTTQLAVHYYGSYQYYAWIDTVTVVEMTGDYCFPVSNLAADSVDASSIYLSWTDADNNGATYTIYDMADSSIVATGITSTNYQVTGLDASTAYTFGVVANCSSTSMSSIATVTATTGCEGGNCNIYVYAQDSYGDGWNGGTITFMQNDAAVSSYSMPDLGQGVPDTAAVNVCAGTPIVLNWTSGSWDSEITVSIANANGQVVFTEYGSNLQGEFLTLDSCDGAAVLVIDSIVWTIAVNDSTMGTTSPVPGTYTWYTGDTVTIEAFPATGYRMSAWAIEALYDGEIYRDTLPSNDPDFMNPFTFVVDGDILTPLTFKAVFEEAVVCPDSVVIPLFEGFENGIDCWTMANTDVSTRSFISPQLSYQDSGCFLFYYSTNPPQYLITPRLAGTGNNVQVEFYYAVYSADYPESFQIGYSTTTNDTNAFVWGAEQTNLTNTSYVHYSEILNAPGIKYVAIKYTANDMYALFIDNFMVGDVPTCLPPTNLSVAGLTSSSVTLSWTDNINTGATYTIYNLTDSTVVATGIAATTYTVTGLTSATAYTFGVVANCSATDASTMATINVMTDCELVTIYPYTQDFSEAPSCWSLIDADGDGFCWELISGGVHSASYDNNYGPLTPDNWLITPHFQLAANTSYEVTWNANPQDASWPAEHYGLYVSTTNNSDTAAFTLLQEWTLTATGHVPVVDLSAYAGQNIYLAFRHWNCTDMFRIALDNFELREAAGSNQITVTLTQNNPMYGSVSGSGVYTIGDSVTVTATPSDNYTFSRWTNVAGTTVSTANPYTFVATTDITLEAIFVSNEAETYTITVAVNDSTMGTATGGGTYTAGDVAVLTATPYPGYRFVNWTWNEMAVSDDNPFSMTVTSNSASYPIVANFEPDTVVEDEYLTLITAVNDRTMGTITPAPGEYQYYVGDSIMFSVTANEGYHFESANLTILIMGMPFVDTTITMDISEFNFVVDEMMVGFTITVTANFAADSVVGIDGVDPMAAVRVYPNPTQAAVTVDADNLLKVDVLDINGREVATFEKNSFDLSFLSAGVYMLRIETTVGTAVRRIVKK